MPEPTDKPIPDPDDVDLPPGVDLPGAAEKPRGPTPQQMAEEAMEKLKEFPAALKIAEKLDGLDPKALRALLRSASANERAKRPWKPSKPRPIVKTEHAIRVQSFRQAQSVIRMLNEYFTCEREAIRTRSPAENARNFLECFTATSFTIPGVDVVSQVLRDDEIVESVKRNVSKENRYRLARFHGLEPKSVTRIARAGKAFPPTLKAA